MKLQLNDFLEILDTLKWGYSIKSTTDYIRVDGEVVRNGNEIITVTVGDVMFEFERGVMTDLGAVGAYGVPSIPKEK